jgi:hypothetical protein
MIFSGVTQYFIHNWVKNVSALDEVASLVNAGKLKAYVQQVVVMYFVFRMCCNKFICICTPRVMTLRKLLKRSKPAKLGMFVGNWGFAFHQLVLNALEQSRRNLSPRETHTRKLVSILC